MEHIIDPNTTNIKDWIHMHTFGTSVLFATTFVHMES